MLVGGAAAARYVGHRASFGHYVLADLHDRFDLVLDAIERTDGWVTNRVVPGELGEGVASQVARQLAEPRPADERTTGELPRYKRLDPRWHDWRSVVEQCQTLADAMLEQEDGAR